MTGIDTNILIRFFVQDDPDQCLRVDEFFQSLSTRDPGFVALVTLAEFAWVLQRRYRVSKAQFIDYLEQLFNSSEIVLENEAALKQAMVRFGSANAGFADCLIERVCSQAGCARTVTFDTTAAKWSGMSLL
jgi:predicted nucleic-acid-binding protein